MNYKGVDYHYAFEFKIPIENSNRDRILNVVISNYRENTQDFSGLCLENELRVISEEKMLFAAFFDIVDSIVKITTDNEKAYFETHNIHPTPLLSVTERAFLEKFNECKQSKKSLEYYERLRIAFERPQGIKDKFFKPSKPDIFGCDNIVPFMYLVQAKQVPIKDVNFFRL
jgi:hypothetical protein